MAETSLFSRAHTPRVSTPKKIRGFLALPGEIRNQIYNFYFDSKRRCEIASKGANFTQQKPQSVQMSSNLITTNNATRAAGFGIEPAAPTVVRFSRSLGKYNAVQGLRTNWPGSLYALSLVCKQVYTETAKFLYQETIFVFDAPKRMVNFFNFASTIHMGSITRLHLHYDVYGHPWSSVDVIWQEKHSQSWLRACRTASKTLTGLRELEIWVKIHYAAPKFSLREDWLKPLLQFRRLARSGNPVSQNGGSRLLVRHQSGLQMAKIHVQTRWSRYPGRLFYGNARLPQASTDLHLLYGQAIGLAITGATEDIAMAGFEEAWEGKYAEWKSHLQFARTGW